MPYSAAGRGLGGLDGPCDGHVYTIVGSKESLPGKPVYGGNYLTYLLDDAPTLPAQSLEVIICTCMYLCIVVSDMKKQEKHRHTDTCVAAISRVFSLRHEQRLQQTVETSSSLPVACSGGRFDLGFIDLRFVSSRAYRLELPGWVVYVQYLPTSRYLGR